MSTKSNAAVKVSQENNPVNGTEVKKVELPVPDLKPEQRAAVAVETRVQKIDKLHQWNQQRQRLKKELEKLRELDAADDKSNVSLMIEGSENFETSNTFLITQVTKFLSDLFVEKINEVERQILNEAV